MKIKTLFLALLCLSLPSTTYSEHIYWDCNNDCDISAGLDRNSRNEIFIDNAGSNRLKFIPFTFNNPDSCDFSFKIRLRDGDEIDNASRLLSPSAPSAEFGIVWTTSTPTTIPPLYSKETPTTILMKSPEKIAFT